MPAFEVVVVGPEAEDTSLDLSDSSMSVRSVDAPATARDFADASPDCVVVDGALEEPAATARTAIESTTAPAIVTEDRTSPSLAAELSRTDGVEYAPRDALSERDESLRDRVAAAVESAGTEDDHRRRRVVEFLGDGVYATDGDGHFRLVNPAFAELTGYDRGELLGRHASKVVSEADVEAAREALRDLLEAEDRSIATYRATIERDDGESVPVEVTLTPDETGPGSPGAVGVIRDLTDRQRRQRRLEGYETIVETAPIGVFMLDETGTITDHDDEAMEMLGLSGESYVGRPFVQLVEEDVFEPSVVEEYLDLVRHLLSSSNDDETGVLRTQPTVDGETRYVDAYVGLLPYDEEFRGVAGILHDVTERRQRAEELEAERTFTESLLNTLPDLFYVLDGAGRITRWNDQLEAVTGYDGAELEEMHATELIVPEDRDAVAAAMARVYERGVDEQLEAHLLTADGDRVPYQFSGNLVENVDEGGRGIVGIGRDVTQRKRRERRLAVLRRVLRHNLRNDVTVLRGAADRIRERVDDTTVTESAETVQDIAVELEDLAETARLIEDVIDRGDVADGTSTDATALLRDVIDRFEREYEDVTFETGIEDGLLVNADDRLATAMEQLVENAVEHGRSDFRAAERSDGLGTVTVRGRRVDESTVELAVLDDGPGIEETETVAADPDPEITQLRHGSGLGLWLVRWIVRSLDGTFEIETRDEGGTAVRVRLATPASPSL